MTWDRADAIEELASSDLEPTPRSVARAMAWDANEAGVYRDTQVRLAQRTGFSVRTIRYALDHLEEQGVITRLVKTTTTWWRLTVGRPALDAGSAHLGHSETADPDRAAGPPFPSVPKARSGSVSSGGSMWTHGLEDQGGELGRDEDDVGTRTEPRPEPTEHVAEIGSILEVVFSRHGREPEHVHRQMRSALRCSDTFARYLIRPVRPCMPDEWLALPEEQRLADVAAAVDAFKLAKRCAS